jgi:glycerol-3-phosphate dehydrogenase
LGAEGYHALVNQVDRLAAKFGLPRWRVQHLLDRYGSMAQELFDLAADDATLLHPLEGAEEYLRVEVLYAATNEAALHLDDLLARRTRISIETPDRGTASARAVAELVAPALGWDEERVNNEVAAYEARVEAERESQRKDDDLEADAARIAAPDTRAVAVGRALD